MNFSIPGLNWLRYRIELIHWIKLIPELIKPNMHRDYPKEDSSKSRLSDEDLGAGTLSQKRK